ncbi:MAG: hypothetical protein JRG96_11390 [Deltaproteobacteria bacterium]|nr:hypothetical protein [Deltaproteobacteria bacterium]MBW2418949.1 hypothetical protein [Deltaproteobacteria bacterium]
MDGIPAIAQVLRDLLQAFIDHEVRFLVVGGYALAVHGHPRATGDLGVWIECDRANALRAFDAPLHDLTVNDLTTPGTVFQIGLPPIRIDILTRITGVEFAPAWTDRLEPEIDGLRVPVIGRDALLANKRALGRLRDQADVELLESTSDG